MFFFLLSELDIFGTHTGTYDNANPTFITSPNYPGGYDYDLDCRWTIKTLNDRIMALHFTDFLTEAYDDPLDIYNGSNPEGTLLATLSGNSYPSLIFPTGKTTFLRFTTSPQIYKNFMFTGFRISLKTYGK